MGLAFQNIAIVGCGPGGLASAMFLARQGHQVTLFERFSEPKPLGSGLLIQPSGQDVLESLGLLPEIKRLASPVHQLHGISTHKGRRALDMQYKHAKAPVSALGIHRASLFDVLIEAVRLMKIPIEVNNEFIGVNESGSDIKPLFSTGGHDGTFDLLIDASGARTPLATGRIRKLSYGAFWATVDMPAKHQIAPNALDQRYWHASKMAGIMPVGINPATGNPGAAIFWSEKPENTDQVINAGIERFRSEFVSLWPEAEPFVAQIGSMDELTMAVYEHRTGRPDTSTRLYSVGDSWHCTSPQLGQGANMALLDAKVLAKAIERAETTKDISRSYRRSRSFHINLYQLLSVIFTPLYQSNGRFLPFIRDVAIHNFARLPLVRSLITYTVSGVLGLKLFGQRRN
ncbi:FAD-dependent monooxygenase [Sphingorhabdus sp. Alg231-15]|uniref:FAD-dependent monooxygenase n=1 Tax=Sphingorhabdus sp. Alg231-15 TaxID=1922222 RepID=UPI000D55F00B